jgi:hypothetical protein
MLGSHSGHRDWEASLLTTNGIIWGRPWIWRGCSGTGTRWADPLWAILFGHAGGMPEDVAVTALSSPVRRVTLVPCGAVALPSGPALR